MSEKLKPEITNKPRKRQALVRLNGRLVAVAMTILICTMLAGGSRWVWTTGIMERVIRETRWQLVSISLNALLMAAWNGAVHS